MSQTLTATDRTENRPLTARVAAAATTNLTSVKAAKGNVYGWSLHNNTAAAKFVKFYDKASAPVPASDTPKFTLIIPASSYVHASWSTGIPFFNGIAYSMTGAITDTDTTALALNDVHGVIAYI